MRRLLAALALALALVVVSSHAFAFDPFLVARARADIGKSAHDLGLHRVTLWCSAYLDYLTGRHVGDRAKDWAALPKAPACTPGSIAVMRRGKNGGHAGVTVGCDERGNAIVISGNHNKRVGEGVYPKGRVYAWVIP